MKTDLKPNIIQSNVTLRSALDQLNLAEDKVLLVVSTNGQFLRTLTDGDLRRYLLSGATMESALSGIPHVPPKTIAMYADDSLALELMNQAQIDHLPVVDGEGRPLGLHVRQKIQAPILLSTPHLGDEEIQFVAQAFTSNWIAPLGPNVDAFEQELAERVGIGYAAAVSSGTAAIHLALRLLNVGVGDTVFCSTLTFVASANPIVYQGATPVFIDSDLATWNMSPTALTRALGEAARKNALPKAVIVVNLYGQSADMDPIVAICSHYGVPVVEDAAESLGATYKDRASGTFGKLGIFSFNGNKIITTSGGGMLVSDDKKLIEQARFLATQARDDAPYYQHTQVGYNYRMSNILAGVGRGQLKVLNDRVNARRAVFDRYQSALSDLPGLEWMPEADFGRANRWLTLATLDSSKTQKTATGLIAALAKNKIEARHVWKPMHLQPMFKNCAFYAEDAKYSVAQQLFETGVCLPSGSNMTELQQRRVIEHILSYLAN